MKIQNVMDKVHMKYWKSSNERETMSYVEVSGSENASEQNTVIFFRST